MKSVILGISAFYHNSAAAIVVDGVVCAAAEEERFSRIKHDDAFPFAAIAYCLREANLSINEVTRVVFYEKPLLRLERTIMSHVHTWPWGAEAFVRGMRSQLGRKIWIEHEVRSLGYAGVLNYLEHHLSHAASAYFASEYDDAAILTVDGVGERETTALYRGRGSNIEPLAAIEFPDSIGLLYSAITSYLGFTINADESKVMGLAPYGNPEVYADAFSRLITITENAYELNRSYFAFEYGLSMASAQLHTLLGGPPQRAGESLTDRHKNIAAALQKKTEEVMLVLGRYAKSRTGARNLCLAGGVALNCVANGALLRSGVFENIFVQPAAGDAGGALGAALYAAYSIEGLARSPIHDVFLGPSYSQDEIESTLREQSVSFVVLSSDAMCERVAELIAEGKVIGWFQGRMEFGPRALGARSILADPRNTSHRDRINQQIKFREDFRPFAPAVLAEEKASYFDLDRESPYMLFTAKARKDLPATTHVDGSARVQTVSAGNPLYPLLKKWRAKTGCAVLLNTSFNTRGEPMVCTPKEAIECFLSTELDALVIGQFLVEKVR